MILFAKFLNRNTAFNIEILIARFKPKQLPKSGSISKLLLANDTAISLSTSCLSNPDTSDISTAATSNLSNFTNSNTATKLISKWSPKAKNDITKLEIGNGSSPTDPQLIKPANRISSVNLGTGATQNPNFQHYLSLLVIPEDATSSNLEPSQQQLLTSNILLATISNNKSLAAIFPFKFEKTSVMPLFSGAIFKEKPIITMYTNAKVDRHLIKLILNSGSADSIITRQLMDQLDCRVDHAASAHIITANGATKTPIGKINDFPIEINGIITFIKVLVMEATQY
ncbi:hypothetical protein G9A89_005484 [Geosiphon pyriformis]|nr:hypothetical protein G9A89_005484 [Geosiphon pyriformis]